jgi:hypothetical protein
MLSVINPITIAPSLYPSRFNVLGMLGRKLDKAERRLTAGQTALNAHGHATADKHN